MKKTEEKKPVTAKPEEKKTTQRVSSSPYVYKPGKTATPATTAKTAKAAPAKATKAATPAKTAAPAKSAGGTGKWVIEEVKGRYWFSLYANNGQVMLESATPYSTLSSARAGIKTYQENIAANHFDITEHKNGDFQVQVLNGRGGLLATSSTYTSRADCEKVQESIKRWAVSTTIEEPKK